MAGNGLLDCTWKRQPKTYAWMTVPNTIQQIRNFIVVAVLLLGISACSTSADELHLLDLAQMHYERALRWQEYDVLLSFHKNEQQTLTTEKRDRLKQFRVTGYNVIAGSVAPDMRHASQVVEVKYYNTDYQVVRDLTLHNEWEFDPNTNRWYLLNPLPDFK